MSKSSRKLGCHERIRLTRKLVVEMVCSIEEKEAEKSKAGLQTMMQGVPLRDERKT